MRVRNVTAEEARDPHLLPQTLWNHGYLYFDREWAWVEEDDNGVPVLLVLGSFCHGVCVFWRVLAAPGAAITHFLVAFPQILQTIRSRGCFAYSAIFNDSSVYERKLRRIMERKGGISLPFQGTFTVAPTEP